MKYLLVVLASIFSYCNPIWCSDSENYWHLSTDDTAITIAVANGVPTVTQLGSVKPASIWLVAPVPEPLLPSVTQNGSSLPTKWRYERGALDPRSGELVLRFSNAAPALELQSIWRARPGRGPIEHWLTIANHSGSVITIGYQDSLLLSHLAIPSDDSIDAWSIKRGASNATLEGGTITRSVGKNSDETLVSDPTDGASPVPWLALQVGVSRGLYVGWEFSGVGRIRFHGLSGTLNDPALGPSTAPGELGIEVGNL
ncbi:MAG: hypothetical protein WAK33_00730, partial [Silvibacterium sp.]